ncbi:MAG TPA: lipid IV(A) 3-deoxy-D-manno-octulosonic acid transferase [Burkholderiales bacterium]|nr:lipid IV(A) 3-deoxy-D-manno-octulosonic acid transferase [Burkholderiales bacterium]
MIKTRFVYTLLTYAMLPFALLHLLWRSRRQPAYLKHIPERFGFYREAPGRPVIWLHAVSVGETRAAEPLVKALRQAHPGHQILLTHMTPTGRETGEQLFGGNVLRCYLPYDFPQAAESFLRHFKPVAGVLLETEIWFNLIHLCKEKKIPLYLVNARLSEKSAARYARFASLVRPALQSLTAVSAQTQQDAERLRALGAASVEVTGSLKFDVKPPSSLLELGGELRSRFGARPVFLAASTRECEEELVLQAAAATGLADLLTVIVSRHPQRFDEVAALLQSRNVRFQRRSENRPVAADTQFILGDSMGEMFAYYAACDVAFVGGSLLPYGGQNLLEACAVGKPVLIGPHTFNFAEAAELAVQAGAAQRVTNVAELGEAIKSLFADAARRKVMGEAGRTFIARYQGATQRILRLIRF